MGNDMTLILFVLRSSLAQCDSTNYKYMGRAVQRDENDGRVVPRITRVKRLQHHNVVFFFFTLTPMIARARKRNDCKSVSISVRVALTLPVNELPVLVAEGCFSLPQMKSRRRPPPASLHFPGGQ